MRPNTPSKGVFPLLFVVMWMPSVPPSSSKTSVSTQYENMSIAGVSPESLSANSFAALRMKPTFQWLSMLRTALPMLPPCPEYDEFHSVLNDFTSALVYPVLVIALSRALLSVTSAFGSHEVPVEEPPG